MSFEVSQINNDEENMALNQTVEEENNLDTTPVAEQQAVEDVDQLEVNSAGETTEESTETTGEQKKGAQNRVREALAAKKAAEARAQSLEQRLAELTGSVDPMANFNPYGSNQPTFNPQEPIVAPNEEIDINELNRRIAAREERLLQMADARSELRQKQSEAVNRINREAAQVIGKFPALNPDSEHFNEKLSNAVTKATEAYIKQNPFSASVTDFVSELMEPYEGAVTKEVGKATENIAKQVSQAALRPTSVRKEEKAAHEKSIAELEAELGVVNS